MGWLLRGVVVGGAVVGGFVGWVGRWLWVFWIGIFEGGCIWLLFVSVGGEGGLVRRRGREEVVGERTVVGRAEMRRMDCSR